MVTIYMKSTLDLLQKTDRKRLQDIKGVIKQTTTGVTYLVVMSREELYKRIMDRTNPTIT